jgi:hypothetical protein
MVVIKKQLDTFKYNSFQQNIDQPEQSIGYYVRKLATIFGVSAEDIKSPKPVIINFHNSPQSNGVNNGEIKNQNEQLLQQLTQQLAIKDE